LFTSNLSRSLSLFAVALIAGFLAGPQNVVAAQGDCSQPLSSGVNPVASDCLFILGVAVNLQACTPQPCVCDPTGDGSTTASDALRCLNKAVAEPVTLLCPCDTTTSSTTTTMPSNSNCTNDGDCGVTEDCVCSDCDDDLFCSNPSSCNHNDICQSFEEGCVCDDCMTHPECRDN
jgi:hypothetical protein